MLRDAGRRLLEFFTWDSTLGYEGEGPRPRHGAPRHPGRGRPHTTSMSGRRWAMPLLPQLQASVAAVPVVSSAPVAPDPTSREQQQQHQQQQEQQQQQQLPPLRAHWRKRKLKRGGSLPDGDEPDQEYEVDEIVNEQRDFKTKRLLYEVVWKGVDPKNGEKWPNELIPATDCNQQLIKDWEKLRSVVYFLHHLSPQDLSLSLCAFLVATK